MFHLLDPVIDSTKKMLEVVGGVRDVNDGDTVKRIHHVLGGWLWKAEESTEHVRVSGEGPPVEAERSFLCDSDDVSVLKP